MLAIVLLVPAARTNAQTTDAAAEQAAREIIAARDRAQRAAEEWVAAETRLDDLQVESSRLGDEETQLEATVSTLRSGVEALALDRFINGDLGVGSLFSGSDGPTREVEAEILSRLAANTATSSVDDLEAASHDLVKLQAALERTRRDTLQAQKTLAVIRQQALDRVEEVKKIETQRLKDVAVRKALEAQRAEQRRQAQAAAEAEARQVAARQAADAATAAAAQAAAAHSAAPGGTASGTAGGSGSSGNSGGSGSGSAGSSAGGAYVDTDVICPIATSAFGDTWGAPRSGGRKHQGVDMISPRGTEIYAVVAGFARFEQNGLGGNAIWLTGTNSNGYYYAHLDSYSGESRNVSQGEVLGYNGDTGNARGTPHLHFEVHPGAGAAVNPTPTVRNAC